MHVLSYRCFCKRLQIMSVGRLRHFNVQPRSYCRASGCNTTPSCSHKDCARDKRLMSVRRSCVSSSSPEESAGRCVLYLCGCRCAAERSGSTRASTASLLGRHLHRHWRGA